MAVSMTYDRVCALIAAGSLSLLGCTGNEPAAAESKPTSASASVLGAPHNLAGHLTPTRAFRPPQQLRLLPQTSEVRPAGLTQEAELSGPVFAAPRLTRPVNSEVDPIASHALRLPELMRLPPADFEEKLRSDAARPAPESTRPSRSMALPQLSTPSTADAPWLWRSTAASKDVHASEHGDATENNRTDRQVHVDTDMGPSELSSSHWSADLPVRLPSLRPNTEPIARPDVTELDSARVDLADPIARQEVELPADDPLPADAPAGRSAASLEMTDAVGRARAAVNRGMELSERKALYSARAEFVQALRLIAQAADDQSGQPIQGRALTSGLRALREAQDFAPQGMEIDVDLNVARYLPSHQTPVIQGEDLRELTAATTPQRYYAYAQQQLVRAAGGQPVASEALVELGKVSLQLYKDELDTLGGPTAQAFYQAALEVDARNARAANELGVLLAQLGQLEPARQMLLQSVMVQPTAQAWMNLSVVHGRLGETDLAERARHESQLAPQTRPQLPEPSIIDSPIAGPPVAEGSLAAEGSPAVKWLQPAAGLPDSGAQVDEVSIPEPTLPASSPPTESTRQAARKGWKRFLPRWPIP